MPLCRAVRGAGVASAPEASGTADASDAIDASVLAVGGGDASQAIGVPSHLTAPQHSGAAFITSSIHPSICLNTAIRHLPIPPACRMAGGGRTSLMLL